MEKIKVQISFDGRNADLSLVREQLESLVKEDRYEFYHCFLPRHIVEEKDLPKDVVDMLDEVLGDNQKNFGIDRPTFIDHLRDIDSIRLSTTEITDQLFVLGSDLTEGIKKEIELTTKGKVKFI